MQGLTTTEASHPQTDRGTALKLVSIGHAGAMCSLRFTDGYLTSPPSTYCRNFTFISVCVHVHTYTPRRISSPKFPGRKAGDLDSSLSFSSP